MSEFDKEVERLEAGANAWEDTEEVAVVEVKQPMDKTMSVHLSDADWRILLAEARRLGMGPNALATKWVLEHLVAATKAKSA